MQRQEYIGRLNRDEMTYYASVYKDSPRWQGESITGKKLIVYCEQGLGDVVQFARYFKYIDAEVILHIQKPLFSLFTDYTLVDRKDSKLPTHDFHILSQSLPFALKRTEVDVPYIKVGKKELNDNSFKIGIAWEGNPRHEWNYKRCCPLKYFKILESPNTNFYMLQKEILLPELTTGAEDFELLGYAIEDVKDTAELVAAMDLVISVDTLPVHLAGAMDKACVALLGKVHDRRWDVGVDWYPSVEFAVQEDNWSSLFEEVKNYVDTFRAKTGA